VNFALAKILLADDSTHAQRMGKKILVAEGYDVTTVSNGQAAIHSLEKDTPDLVVADIFMPGRNGYEVSRFVKANAKLKNVPVLLIIGAMEPYDPEEGKRAGADGLITKPLESSDLVTTVKGLLSSSTRTTTTRVNASRPPAVAEPQTTPVPPPVEETPQWDNEPEEIITTHPPYPKFDIPHELGQQSIGMLTDIMAEPKSGELPPTPVGDAERDRNEEGDLPAMEMADEQMHVADPPPLPQLDLAEKTVWTAEPAPMTPEEGRLFDQPSADWGDLAQLVEQADSEVVRAEAAPQKTEPEPLSVEMQAVPAAEPMPETAGGSEIEYFESLDDVVAAPPMGRASAPAPEAEVPSLSPAPETVLAETPDSDKEVQEPVAEPVEEVASPLSTLNAPPMDPLVRQAVEDMLPEIIERVKKSIKK
jgi:CheY-like chemotaxis protein